MCCDAKSSTTSRASPIVGYGGWKIFRWHALQEDIIQCSGSLKGISSSVGRF